MTASSVGPFVPGLAILIITTACPAQANAGTTPRKSEPKIAILINPLETVISSLVNDLAIVSPQILIGNGRGACVVTPQGYALTDKGIGGAGLAVGFRLYSRQHYDGLYFGVRFGGGLGNRSFKTFLGQLEGGFMWAFGKFRLGVGVGAGGGYFAYDTTSGSLFLFTLDLLVGAAI